VYLTNTLDNTPYKPEFPSSEFISNEANEAAIVKNEDPVMVVVGNPPYSCDSNNRGEWIEKLMEDYKVNVRKEETQIQALSNDYIKFIRFAQWKIDSNSCGILSFVTGHGYIDGPLARDMRGALKKSFHEISVLDLNGSIRKVRNTMQDHDDPVFNIQQGTAITFAIKKSDPNYHSTPKINHCGIFGSENKKDSYLLENDIRSTSWDSINPKVPYFYFVKTQDKSPQDDLLAHEYKSFTCITEIFGTGNRSIDKEKLWATGFATQQDEFAISFDSNEITNKVRDLLSSDTEDDLRMKYKLCTTNQWSYTKSKKELKNILLENKVEPCLFRPFDVRQTVFDRNIVTVLRSKVMSQMQGDNTALIVSRVVNDAVFAHSFVSNIPVDKICISSKTSTNAYVFPLYLYPENNIESSMGIVRRPNFSRLFLKDINSTLRYTPTPETIFHYIYAILHSPEYRSRYSEFLKGDFPRIPITRNVDLFRQLGELGEKLVNLHLMKSPILNETTSQFSNKDGGCIIDAGHPKYENGKVVINKQKDGFMDVPEAVWNFHVGGYQVCHKWLKDRKGRILSQDDIEHYQKIVVALGQSIELMKQIDEAIPSWPIDAEYN
jgi:predicted helicase